MAFSWDSFPLWVKMAIVLAFAIAAAALGAVLKNVYNRYRLRSFNEAGQGQPGEESQPVMATSGHEIPFGARALQIGIRVDGIWVSHTNSPAASAEEARHPDQLNPSSLSLDTHNIVHPPADYFAGRKSSLQPNPSQLSLNTSSVIDQPGSHGPRRQLSLPLNPSSLSLDTGTTQKADRYSSQELLRRQLLRTNSSVRLNPLAQHPTDSYGEFSNPFDTPKSTLSRTSLRSTTNFSHPFSSSNTSINRDLAFDDQGNPRHEVQSFQSFLESDPRYRQASTTPDEMDIGNARLSP